MVNILQAIKLTFGSVWGWLGIIVGAVSLINLGVMYFEVGIGPVLERVVETYKAVVHIGIFDRLLFWLPWDLPPWAKDAAALYSVFAAANWRASYLSPDTVARWLIPFFALGWPLNLWYVFVDARRARRYMEENSAHRRTAEKTREYSEDAKISAFVDREYDEADASLYRMVLLAMVVGVNLIVVPVIAIIFVVVSSGL